MNNIWFCTIACTISIFYLLTLHLFLILIYILECNVENTGNLGRGLSHSCPLLYWTDRLVYLVFDVGNVLMNLLSRQSHHFLNTKISITGHEDNIQAYSLISGNLRYHFLPLGHHHLLSSLALRILETLDHASCAALHHTRYSSIPHLLPLTSYLLYPTSK